MKAKCHFLYSAILITGLLILTACTSTGVKRSNEPPIALKNWNEGDMRLSKHEHQAHVDSLSRQFPGVIFYKGNPTVKRVALTFDDGPDNYYTPKILSILHEKRVSATFFIVGKQAKTFPNMVKRIVNEGHDIGNHSWDHPKFSKISKTNAIQEVQSTENELQRITGRKSDLFRPPYGIITPEQVKMLHNLGFRIIEWSVDTTDWKGENNHQILALVNKEISPGGIILQHCMASRHGELDGTIEALPTIIDHYRTQGYEFVTIHSLLGK